VDLLTLAPLVTRKTVVTGCAQKDSTQLSPGEGYEPADRSGLYLMRADWSLESKVAHAVRILAGTIKGTVGLLASQNPSRIEMASARPFPYQQRCTSCSYQEVPAPTEARWVEISPASSFRVSIARSASAAEARLFAGILGDRRGAWASGGSHRDLTPAGPPINGIFSRIYRL
jgi:hypothetical protein